MYFNTHTHFSSSNEISIVNIENLGLHPFYHSFGIHPWNAENNQLTFSQINEILNHPKCLALGEIGLDKVKGSELEIQKRIFIEQIQLSEKNHLPVILHCVKTWNEILEIKKELKPKQVWIFHGFTKTTLLKSVLEANCMISIGSGILVNENLQKVLTEIPNSQLLLETDAAEISIAEIYQKVAALKNISLLALEILIENNFKRVFTKWQTGSNEQN